MTEAQSLRDAILAARLETSSHGETPQPGTLYVPPSHLKALRLDAHVVVGGRGVGKSFWTSALHSELLRTQLGAVAPELKNVDVFVGFSAASPIDNSPNADVFTSFLNSGVDPYDVWRAVVLRWIAKKTHANIPMQGWQDTVTWLQQQPEDAARLMERPRDWQGLILFDALDRTSADWRHMDDIVRGLLRTVLWLKTYPGLHAKVFLREDQAERTVFAFPDASKLTATQAELTWARHDLHGLLWQRLINAPEPNGALLRSLCQSTQEHGVWQLTQDMKLESETQKRAFEKLAGPWMGRDRRRGVPYTWSVGHLADGRGQTSPRSFLAAIDEAAQDSGERYSQHDYALHFESIRRGIQQASAIRVQEMAEDYPWVIDVLDTLRGLSVPIEFSLVQARWENAFANMQRQLFHRTSLPAQHADRGWDGVRDDLQRLGLLETKKDGRINMPDLYRVGFGLGRRGGVKPKND